MSENMWAVMPVLATEIEAFEVFLRKSFDSQGFVQQAARDMVLGDGKRLRPALTVAAAMVGQYDREKTIPLAAAIEVIHTATLAHDDVIDRAETRRGRQTLFASQGSHIAVYVGDFLLARSLKMLAGCDLPISEMSRLSAAIEEICTGDVAQYLGRNQVPGYRTYLKRIVGKTGILFAAACVAGAYSGQVPEQQQKQLWHFGIRFGTVFQIRDDLLDLDETRERAGKPTGRDLMEGIITLPILLSAVQADYKNLLSKYLQEDRSERGARQLISRARELGSVEQAKNMLDAHLIRCHQSLAELPDSLGKSLLGEITELLHENI